MPMKNKTKGTSLYTNYTIDIPALLRLCQVRDFRRVAQEYDAEEVFGPRMHDTWFIDRGKQSKILAVVHFDTVWRGKGPAPVRLIRSKEGKAIGINSIQLDDRLGAYIILEMLPKLGVTCDVLITTDEEIGKSTARNFTTTKKYNWIFSFDRRGLKPVNYQYGDVDVWEDAINIWSETDWGSFSDICELESLGVCGVNWATAYFYEHTSDCHAYFSDIYKVVTDFLGFYNMNKTVRYPFSAALSSWSRWSRYDSAGYNYRSLQEKIDSEYEDSAYKYLMNKDEFERDDWDDWSPPKVRNSGSKNADNEYLCEFCWQYDRKVAWSPKWGGWLCDPCLGELNQNNGG